MIIDFRPKPRVDSPERYLREQRRSQSPVYRPPAGAKVSLKGLFISVTTICVWLAFLRLTYSWWPFWPVGMRYLQAGATFAMMVIVIRIWWQPVGK
jgi:hypothetical protein